MLSLAAILICILLLWSPAMYAMAIDDNVGAMHWRGEVMPAGLSRSEIQGECRWQDGLEIAGKVHERCQDAWNSDCEERSPAADLLGRGPERCRVLLGEADRPLCLGFATVLSQGGER